MEASLAGWVCGAVAHDEDGALVGMGRVVGDGAFDFYVQDVAVRPEHQGRGLGRAVVEQLLDQVRRVAPGHCIVGLFATSGRAASLPEHGLEGRGDAGHVDGAARAGPAAPPRLTP